MGREDSGVSYGMKPKKRMWRRGGVLLGTVCTVALLVWGIALRSNVIIDTVTIGRGTIESAIAAVGVIQPRRYVDVGAQVSGQIRRLHVQPGDRVKQGQLLTEIDPSLPQARVEANRAALAGLHFQLADQQAQLTLARQQYARQQQLARDGATREEDIQTALATLRSAEARIGVLKAQSEQMQSTLRGEEAQLGYTRIYAPMAGTVVSLDAREGQTLNAIQQTPLLLRIADLALMTVWTDVSEADVTRVKPGMPVYFTTLGADGRRWSSTVRQILPAPPHSTGQSEQTSAPTTTMPAAGRVVLYTVLFDVANTDGMLMPQMTAQVFFVAARAVDVITAPLPALQAVAGRPGVYSARVLNAERQVTRREVHTGVRDRLTAEVLSGLEVGDQLVTGIRPQKSWTERFRL